MPPSPPDTRGCSMADIRPFVATRFAQKNGDNISDLLSPPYDVISPEMQCSLYERNPRNLVRIDYGKTMPADTEFENRYSRAGSMWQEWKQEGTLAEDTKKCFYVYEQEFTLPDGKKHVRR